MSFFVARNRAVPPLFFNIKRGPGCHFEVVTRVTGDACSVYRFIIDISRTIVSLRNSQIKFHCSNVYGFLPFAIECRLNGGFEFSYLKSKLQINYFIVHVARDWYVVLLFSSIYDFDGFSVFCREFLKVLRCRGLIPEHSIGSLSCSFSRFLFFTYWSINWSKRKTDFLKISLGRYIWNSDLESFSEVPSYT